MKVAFAGTPVAGSPAPGTAAPVAWRTVCTGRAAGTCKANASAKTQVARKRQGAVSMSGFESRWSGVNPSLRKGVSSREEAWREDDEAIRDGRTGVALNRTQSVGSK